MQSIPLANPLCLKEVRDISVSSKKRGSLTAYAQTSKAGSTGKQSNPNGGFSREASSRE